ncbi:MAG: serine hydrolase domain-containing protein [Bryobacteraceae bacterium]
MKRTLLLVALASSLMAGGVPAGKPEDAGMSSERLRRIHESLQRHIDAGEISGAVTLVARRGRIVHFEAHGLMGIESKRPMTKDAIFRLASMTKPVTSVAVLMLVEEGKIRLSDPVAKFLPEFKGSKVSIVKENGGAGLPDYYVIPAERDITVQDLLTHTSGLVSWKMLGTKLAPARTPEDTLATYVPRLAAVPLDFQPGTRWEYSGAAGPDVLARIVEIVSGLPYDRFLRTRIFEPLGMNDTFFYPPDDRRPRLPTLYQRTEKGLVKSPNQDGFSSPTYFSAGGGLMSTAEDYAQFAQMLLNGGTLNGKRLLGPRTVELMASNHVGDLFNGKLGRPAHGMGFGLLVAVIQDHVAAALAVSNGSFGWDGAFGTQTWIDPKEQMVEIVMLQEQVVQAQRDFEGAVRQAIVE